MKITVITVCLNSQNTIVHTLNSILSQTYKNIEHIIVDGGSKDNTLEILKNYPLKQKKIIISKGSGIYKAINIGIKKSSGEIVSILNSDDIYQNQKVIEKIVNISKKNKNKDIFLGDVVYFENNNFNNIYRHYSAANFQRWKLKYGYMPPHPASFIRKKLYEKNGYYNEKFLIASDFDLFLRFLFLEKNKYKIINQVCVRMRAGGISGKNLKSYIISTKEIIESFRINKVNTTIINILLRIPTKTLQYFLNDIKKLNKNFIKPKIKYGSQYLKSNFRLIKNIKSIPFNKNFILSGMNLAFLGYYVKNYTMDHPDQYHWPDGVFSKTFFKNIKKIPGRKILNNLKIGKKIKSISIIGNCSDHNYEFIKKKFNLPVKIYPVVYGSIEKILKNLKFKVKKNSLIFITLPTPKQEQLAYKISKNNKKFQIICIGASISLASLQETPVPKYLENFEFIWRLRSDTYRRLLRLIESLSYFLYGRYFTSKLRDINLELLDEK